jgi:hypothetical protein
MVGAITTTASVNGECTRSISVTWRDPSGVVKSTVCGGVAEELEDNEEEAAGEGDTDENVEVDGEGEEAIFGVMLPLDVDCDASLS